MKLDTDLWRKLPAAGAVLLTVGIAGLGVLYWNNVRTREEYLRGRNFRLLAVLASQTENIIATRARIIRRYDEWPIVTQADSGCEPPQWIKNPAPWIKTALSDRKTAVKECGTQGLPVAAATVSGADGRIVLTWDSGVRASLPAEEVLGDTFKQKRKQRAFDTVAIATPNGSVIYADGARSTELEVMPLGTLLPPASTTNADFRSVANLIAEYPVSIAGVRYHLFVQPCCRGVGSVNNLTGPGLAIVGLVEESALRSASLAVSPLLVLSAVVAVLAALVSAVFLKVAFSSLRQRMSALDALQLAASSVFGIAMATILLVTVGAYVSLRADVEDQLERLSAALDKGLNQEISAAYQQDKRVTEALLRSDCEPLGTNSDRARCWANDRITAEFATGRNPYPGPTAVAIVDDKGDQRIKAAPLDRGIPVNVADRSYFAETAARDADGNPTRIWPLPQCGWRSGADNGPPAGCVIESVWSWITAKPQVLMAIPLPRKDLPVASIAIPMRSAIDPILPAGLEFAVVDADGLVLLHSDSARNVNENFLAEADQNPRLRALMAAHSAGHVSIDYWGRPYRAHVRPSAIDGWSIVTMFDEQHARALALEWAAASLVLLTIYMAACVVVLLVVFKTSTAWLWPDPKRRAAYPLLAGFYALSIAVFGVFAGTADSTTRLSAGIVLPGIALGVTILVLAIRPKIDTLAPDWSAVNRDYLIMAAVGLVLTAVVPGIAIVAFSHDLHMESFIKHRQIGLARAMASRPKWRQDTDKIPHDLDDVDNYARVFFDTKRETEPDGDEERHKHRSIVHMALEDYMPFLSPFSVEMRELSHEDADDDTWRSHPKDGRLFVKVRRPGLSDEVKLSSVLPALTASRAIGAAKPFAAVGVLLACAGLAFAIWRGVSFVLRRLFLSDVVEPIPAIRELLGTIGQDMFVVCKDPVAVASQIKGGETLLITPLAASGNLDAAWRQVQDAGDKAGPARAVVIPDLDKFRNRLDVMRRKLRLIEGLMDRSSQTVVLLSTVSPQGIAASATEWRGTKTDRHAEQLLARFQVFDWRDAVAVGETGCLAMWWSALRAAWKQRLEWVGKPSEWCHASLQREERESPEAIKRICADLLETKAVTSGDLTCSQVLDEVEERARPIYLRMWRGCTGDERIVLEHVAVNGLANCGSRHIVRGLLTRGLLRKDPELRLMNRSFTNFVLAAERRLEVNRLEVATEPGLWNHLRVPLGVGATAVVIFLMTTQREMFDSTVTVAAGVTTALPTLLRLTSIFASLGLTRPSGEARTA